MKKILTLLFFILITGLSFGQSKYQDVVYLKDGSIIRGIIIEQVPNKSIKIETADKSIFVFQMDEIEKLTKEPFQGKKNVFLNGTGMQTGYKGTIEIGYEIGTGYYGIDRIKLNIINGYQLNPFFSLGIGTGLRYYYDAESVLVPIFADFRVNFMDNKVSPYFSLGFGYSFDATYRFESVGLLINPTIGVSLAVSDKSTLNVGMGYEVQRVRYYDSWWGGISSLNSGALSFNVGISF